MISKITKNKPGQIDVQEELSPNPVSGQPKGSEQNCFEEPRFSNFLAVERIRSEISTANHK